MTKRRHTRDTYASVWSTPGWKIARVVLLVLLVVGALTLAVVALSGPSPAFRLPSQG